MKLMINKLSVTRACGVEKNFNMPGSFPSFVKLPCFNQFPIQAKPQNPAAYQAYPKQYTNCYTKKSLTYLYHRYLHKAKQLLSVKTKSGSIWQHTRYFYIFFSYSSNHLIRMNFQNTPQHHKSARRRHMLQHHRLSGRRAVVA